MRRYNDTYIHYVRRRLLTAIFVLSVLVSLLIYLRRIDIYHLHVTSLIARFLLFNALLVLSPQLRTIFILSSASISSRSHPFVFWLLSFSP